MQIVNMRVFCVNCALGKIAVGRFMVWCGGKARVWGVNQGISAMFFEDAAGSLASRFSGFPIVSSEGSTLRDNFCRVLFCVS